MRSLWLRLWLAAVAGGLGGDLAGADPSALRLAGSPALPRTISFEHAKEKDLPKIAYFYQADGWNRPDLRPIQAKCLRVFVHNMKDWHVRAIDNTTWQRYVESQPLDLYQAQTPAQFEHLLMLTLLKETGGLWVGESVLLRGNNVNSWRAQPGEKPMLWDNAAGMYALSGPAPKRQVSTMFVVATVGSPLISRWYDAVHASPVWGAPSTMGEERQRKAIQEQGHLAWIDNTLKAALRSSSPEIQSAWDRLPQGTTAGTACEAPVLSDKVVKCSSEQCRVDVPACSRAAMGYEDKSLVDLDNWLPYFLDRRFAVPKMNHTRGGRLFYIHIPKTGGTAIENMGRQLGYSWGRFDRHYDGMPGDGHPRGSNTACGSGGSPWHEPFHYARRPGPQQTFCVIREPISRFLSEYNFRANKQTCGPDFLEQYVETKLNQLYVRSRHDDDCHLLPQEDYVQSCDYVIPHDKKLAGLTMFLRVRFNVSIKQFDQVQPIFAAQGKRCDAKVHNLTDKALDRIKTVYKADIQIYQNARKDFGRLLKEGLVSPQIPDMCGKNRECTEGHSDCPHSGCLDPWLDEPVANEWRCIRTGCDPRNKQHLRRKKGWDRKTKENAPGVFADYVKKE